MIYKIDEIDKFIEQLLDSNKWDLDYHEFPNPTVEEYKFSFKSINKISLVIDFYHDTLLAFISLYGLTNKRYFIDNYNEIDNLVIQIVKDEAFRLSSIADSLIKKSNKYIDTLELIYNK